jgi:DNA-binding LacI/PurR family transcriptional regulator
MDVTGHTSARPSSRRTKTGSVSIRDVARAAGVSYQTVSRVINGQAGVKESTRQSVLASIRELGFRPNQAATVPGRRSTRRLIRLSS